MGCVQRTGASSDQMQAGVRSRASGYTPLRQDADNEGVSRVHDPRFDIPPEEVPWGSIVLAAFLTVFGAVCFALAWMHFTQQIFGKEQAEIAFSLVGLLTFIPGAYHTWIAICVWRGVPGYHWSDIPH